MEYVVLFFVGLVVGIFLMSFFTASKVDDLTESLNTQIKLRKNRDEALKIKNRCEMKYYDIKRIVKGKGTIVDKYDKIKEITER